MEFTPRYAKSWFPIPNRGMLATPVGGQWSIIEDLISSTAMRYGGEREDLELFLSRMIDYTGSLLSIARPTMLNSRTSVLQICKNGFASIRRRPWRLLHRLQMTRSFGMISSI